MSRQCVRRIAPRGPGQRRSGLLRRWFATNSVAAGLFALGWLVLRSGTRPSRLVYPCQRAALATATLALGAPLVGLVIAARRRLAGGFRGPAGVAVAALVVVGGLAAAGLLLRADAAPRPLLSSPDDYRAQVFHVASCPEDPAGERFPGLDALVDVMGHGGLRLYRSPTASLLAGPDGLIAADSVVVVKVNYQWPERGGTNTDLLRGLLRVLLDHPDGFAGEIVVCENTQSVASGDLDRELNNAQDHGQSPRDVVAALRLEGHRVSLTDWSAIRLTSAAEYSTGDLADG